HRRLPAWHPGDEGDPGGQARAAVQAHVRGTRKGRAASRAPFLRPPEPVLRPPGVLARSSRTPGEPGHRPGRRYRADAQTSSQAAFASATVSRNSSVSNSARLTKTFRSSKLSPIALNDGSWSAALFAN